MNKTGLILLSGGLDSLISLDIAIKTIEIKLALIFDYGQKAFDDEKDAAIEIAKKYKIDYQVIKVPFLSQILDNALVNIKNNNFDDFNSVWIPNRNGLFLNIAACYCEKFNYKYIVFGANKEEAKKFIDNSFDFIKNINKTFKYSTLNSVEVVAPCLELDKIEIINYAIDNAIDLKLIKSCYKSSTNDKKHCGECMSCKYLYNALLDSKKPELIREIF